MRGLKQLYIGECVVYIYGDDDGTYTVPIPLEFECYNTMQLTVLI